jgi:uncharacterized coiled-coil protein SlyX
MAESDRQQFLAAMYRDVGDDDKPKRQHDDIIDPSETGMRKTRKIIMGAVAVTVPSVEYVESLEQKLLVQEQAIAELSRYIKRLDATLNQTRQFARRQGANIADLQHDIIQKVDRQ